MFFLFRRGFLNPPQNQPKSRRLQRRAKVAVILNEAQRSAVKNLPAIAEEILHSTYVSRSRMTIFLSQQHYGGKFAPKVRYALVFSGNSFYVKVFKQKAEKVTSKYTTCCFKYSIISVG